MPRFRYYWKDTPNGKRLIREPIQQSASAAAPKKSTARKPARKTTTSKR